MLRALALAIVLLSEVQSTTMLLKALRHLQFLFYAILTYYAPYDFRTIPPQNYVIFVPDVVDRRYRTRQTARSYLSFIAHGCPHGAGEAVVKKIELMKSSRIPNHEFLICYVKDHRNIYGREAVIRIERFSDSAPPYWGPTRFDIMTPSLGQPPIQDKLSPSSESVSRTSNHALSPESFCLPARDRFAITCIPVIPIEDYDILSTLTFTPNSAFTIEEAAVIAMVASAAAEECSDTSYPYARVIYNIILESQAGNLKHTKGKGPLEDIVTSKQLTQTYVEKWREFQVDVQERIEVLLLPVPKAGYLFCIVGEGGTDAKGQTTDGSKFSRE